MNNSPQRYRINFLSKVLILTSALLTHTAFALTTDNTDTPEVENITTEKRFADWDVLNPAFPLNEINIKSNELTWASLDVTPNGKQIVFDTLGDIFITSIDGGDAVPLTQDFAWNIHPTSHRPRPASADHWPGRQHAALLRSRPLRTQRCAGTDRRPRCVGTGQS